MPKLVHPELSYQVRGVLFDVYNTLGPMLKEEYYQDAIVLGMEKRGITCEPEKGFEVYYEGERVGLYCVDVWVDDGKMLLEIKVAAAIEPVHRAQAISYLKVTDADLAIVVNYGGPSLDDERLPNFVRGKRPPPETISLAEEKEIPLIAAEYTLFEMCGRLYEAGMSGCDVPR